MEGSFSLQNKGIASALDGMNLLPMTRWASITGAIYFDLACKGMEPLEDPPCGQPRGIPLGQGNNFFLKKMTLAGTDAKAKDNEDLIQKSW